MRSLLLLAAAASAMNIPKGLYHPSGDTTDSTAAAPDLSSLRWLLYDGHAAPHLDTLGTVRRMWAVQPEKVSSVCFYMYCDRVHDSIKDDVNPGLSDKWAGILGHREDLGANVEATTTSRWLTARGIEDTAKAFASPAGKELANSFDVAVCSFPGHNCLRLAALNKTLVIRFAHRFDHWTRPSDLAQIQSPYAEFFQRQRGWAVVKPTEFIEQLRQLASNPKHIIAVTNAFDWAYLYHYTGIKALSWPSTGAHLNAEWTPATTGVIPIIPGHSPQNRAIAWIAQEMFAYSETNKLNYRAQYVAKYAPGGLSNYPCAVVLPYSVHAGMVIEAYASGVPLLAPSLEFAATMHATCGLVSHWTAQNMPRLHRDYWANESVCSGAISQSGMTSPIDLKMGDTEAVRTWLAFADVYRLPQITYFDSVEDMYRKIAMMMQTDPADRAEQSRAQRQYMADLRAKAAAEIGSRIAAAVKVSSEELARRPGATCPTPAADGKVYDCLGEHETFPGRNPQSCAKECKMCAGLKGHKLNPLRQANTLSGGYAGYGGYSGYSDGYAGGYADTGSPTGSPSVSPSMSPSKSPTSGPSKNPTGSPTMAPSASPGTPTTSPSPAPSGSPTTSPTSGPSGSPSTTAPSMAPTAPTNSPTASPTVALPPPGVQVPPATLGASVIASSPELTAINTVPPQVISVVFITQIITVAFQPGPKSFSAPGTGLPAITITIVTVPVVVPAAGGSTQMDVPCSLPKTEVLSNPSGYKASLAWMFARDIGVPVIQIRRIVIIFADGLTIGRHAKTQQDTANIQVTVGDASTATQTATQTESLTDTLDPSIGVDNDDFPGYAIALCVVLPLLFVGGAIAAVVVLCGEGSPAEGEGEGMDEADKEPYGDNQQ